MVKKVILLHIILLLNVGVFSQEFTRLDCGLVNVGRSSVAWGDYDNDGDLDVLLTGDHGSGPYVASVYRNDAGEFTNINAGLTGIYNSAVAWGDYDKDGDLDILASGRNSINSKTFIYKNINGTFTQLEAGLPAIGSDGAVAWGDYDGDNDLDILIAGAYSCAVWSNNNGVFTDINAGLPPISNCWVDWGDFDNDGDLDIYVMGDLGGILKSAIYVNNIGVYNEIAQAAFTPLAGGSSSWYDYDKDNDLDLLVTGFNEFLEPQTNIYENLGNMLFNAVFPGLTGASLGTAAWGDYDNDGDADILLTGQNAGCGILSSIVYRNDGNNVFTDIGAPLDGAERGAAAWGDYDNDGDLDILITGITGAGTPGTRLYSNNLGSNTFSANLPPSVPDGLSVFIDNHSVTLGWNDATDDHTPAKGLTYNLRITNSLGINVVPAMADPLTGKRLMPQPGNMGNNTNWFLNLPDETYFWSVQAIDHTLAASAFSDIYTFTVLNVGMDDNANTDLSVFPNPVSHSLMLISEEDFRFEIIFPDGRLLATSGLDSKSVNIDTSSWEAGFYILKVTSEGRVSLHKIIKK